MRTAAVATQYITNLKIDFTNSVYLQALLRARGIGTDKGIYEQFYIFSETLDNNEFTEFLTPLQQNQLIDYLVSKIQN